MIILLLLFQYQLFVSVLSSCCYENLVLSVSLFPSVSLLLSLLFLAATAFKLAMKILNQFGDSSNMNNNLSSEKDCNCSLKLLLLCMFVYLLSSVIVHFQTSSSLQVHHLSIYAISYTTSREG